MISNSLLNALKISTISLKIDKEIYFLQKQLNSYNLYSRTLPGNISTP